MDGSRFLKIFLFIAFSILAGCSQEKSVATVFPDSEKNTSNPSACTSNAMNNQFMVTWDDGHFEVVKSDNVDDFIETFVKPNLQELKYVEYDRVITFPKNETTSETKSADVSTMASSDYWGQTKIKSSTVHAKGYEGNGVIVGVVDSAVDLNHPQLKNQVIAAYDFMENNVLTSVEQCNKHGTHVAGIIAADPDLGIMKGVAPKAKIVSAAFLGYEKNTNCSVHKGGFISDAIRGINYVVNQGATVVNASWGGTLCSKTLSDRMKALASQGVIFAVAAGNDGVDFDVTSYYTYPAIFNLSNQITVAASGPNDYLTTFSNRSSSLVHIAAPGEGILSTVPGGYYEEMDGTSMATPFVSGAVALLKSSRPTASIGQIKTALYESVDKYSSSNRFSKVLSRGRMNVNGAVEYLQSH